MTNIKPVFNVVLVEWDGMKPPTTWYNRLRSMGLRVMGNKTDSPLQRRACGSGVIYQEGMIMVNTPEQAVAISQLASSLGATNVATGELSIEGYKMTEKERSVLSTLQQRGRPSKASDQVKEAKHSMTCLNEMLSREVTPKTLANESVCPVCGSTAIKMRLGSQTRVHPYDTSSSVFKYWAKTHFISGSFEKPVFDTNLANEEELYEHVDRAIEFIKGTKLYIAIYNSPIQPEKLMRVLDFAYRFVTVMLEEQDEVSRASRATNNHLKGFSVYYQLHPNPDMTGSLTQSPDELGMVDLLPYLEKQHTPLNDLTTEEILQLCDTSL